MFQYSEIAQQYMEKFQNILEQKHFRINITHPDEITVQFTIITKDTGEEVGNARMKSILNQEHYSRLRSKTPYIANEIYIEWISIEDKFQGQCIASRLILAAICYMYVYMKREDDYKYVTLEDVSDRNAMNIKGNIYNRLGFVPVKPAELASIRGKIISNITDSVYKITEIDHLFRAIIPMKMGGGRRSTVRTVKRTQRTQRTQRKHLTCHRNTRK
jgi:hypothetical protein